MVKIKRLDNNQEIIIPISPSTFEIQTANNNQMVNVTEIGDVLLKGKPSLDKVTFSSFFPNEKYSYCQCSPDKPYNYVNVIEKIEKEAIPVNLTIDNAFSKSCLIDSFNYSENAGSLDVNYTITFTEYKQCGDKRASTTVKKHHYTCKKGDTFYSVARKCTGSTSNAAKIAKYNKMKVNAKLSKGKKLVIKI